RGRCAGIGGRGRILLLARGQAEGRRGDGREQDGLSHGWLLRLLPANRAHGLAGSGAYQMLATGCFAPADQTGKPYGQALHKCECEHTVATGCGESPGDVVVTDTTLKGSRGGSASIVAGADG